MLWFFFSITDEEAKLDGLFVLGSLSSLYKSHKKLSTWADSGFKMVYNIEP
jgi:hypothetical protein